MNDPTSPREVTVSCIDALGRRRRLAVTLTDRGISFRTPPGESASLDWFEVDQLRQHLTTFRPHLTKTTQPPPGRTPR
jgi:hypothetical protein